MTCLSSQIFSILKVFFILWASLLKKAAHQIRSANEWSRMVFVWKVRTVKRHCRAYSGKLAFPDSGYHIAVLLQAARSNLLHCKAATSMSCVPPVR